MVDQIEDGVHLNLSAEDYFGQVTMGSTDWGRLHSLKLGWWWQSRHNPRRKPPTKTDPNLNYGSALHAIMLEGLDAYEWRYAVQPDKASYEGLVETIPEMKAALDRAGVEMVGSSKFTKPQWATAMHSQLPHVPCWANLMDDFKAAVGDKPIVTSDEDWALRFMQQMAVDPDRADNAEIRGLLVESEGHPPLAEVSVFAMVDGIRRRWRFDRLFPGATMDLKSLGGWRGRPLDFEAGEVGARNGWLIQRADYAIGRRVACELIRQGKLFGGDLDQRRYLREIAEQQTEPFWLWVVYQKPDGAGVPPILMPIHNDHGSVLHEYGDRKLRKAIAFYREAVAEFGLDRPWGRVEPLHYTDERHFGPQVHFPHWVAEDEPTTPDAYPTASEEESQ